MPMNGRRRRTEGRGAGLLLLLRDDELEEDLRQWRKMATQCGEKRRGRATAAKAAEKQQTFEGQWLRFRSP